MQTEQVQDLELQTILLKEINKKLKQKAKDQKYHTIPTKELETTFEKTIQLQTHTLIKTISVFLIIFAGSFFGILYVSDNIVTKEEPLSTNFIIENLRGDTIGVNTQLNVESDTVSIAIVDKVGLNENIINSIKNVITSEKTIEIDGSITHKTHKGDSSKYYLGWKGALESISKSTKYNIPKSFTFSNNGDEQITIELVSYLNPEGYDGFAKLIMSKDKKSIEKVHIRIFDADEKSKSDIETIVRHEFGHALGLKHSTDPDDLMHITILSEYPYISECSTKALLLLYDDKMHEEYECQS